MKFFTDLRLLILAIWLGAAFFFIAVAQSSFAVLPQRELAGAVVNRTLSILNYSGIGISLLVLLLGLAGSSKASSKVLVWTERVLLILVAAACAIGQFVIGLMLFSVRGQMGGRPIDEVPIDDPLRVQFNQLHEYSTWVLFTAMGAALIAFFVIANRKSHAAKSSIDEPFNFDKEFRV